MSTRNVEISSWKAGTSPVRRQDIVAAEEPLEIRIDNHPVTITMRTPGHDIELAAGFLVSENLLRRRQDILRIQPYPRNKDKNVINVFLSPDVAVDLQQLTRHVFASSSCGLCGKATIESVQQKFPAVRSKVRIDAQIVLKLPSLLRSTQKTFDATGGLHGAALFDVNGNLIVAREDIGRHNAVDKVLGHAFLENVWPLDQMVLVVSGRASFEIMQKALAARIPMVCAVSAPSSLAVDFAKKSRQTLVGFLRDDKMNIYSCPQRISFSGTRARRKTA